MSRGSSQHAVTAPLVELPFHELNQSIIQNEVLILASIAVMGPPEQFSTLYNGYYFFIFILKI